MRISIFILSVTALLFAAGCQKHHGPASGQVPDAVVSAFNQMYPGAQDVQWSAKQSYWVASFDAGVQTKSAPSDRNAAWYDFTGKWYMTEQPSELSLLPQAVKDAFEASEYAAWAVDDVDILHRNGVETYYVIEVEGVKDNIRVEVELYWSEDGVLVKEIIDPEDDYDYRDCIPERPTTEVANAVEALYPGAKILEVDEDDGAIEVEIVDADRVNRELYFSYSLDWLWTEWDVRYADLPEAVKQTLSQYTEVDDITYIKTPQTEYYEVEIEERGHDRDIRVAIDGTLL